MADVVVLGAGVAGLTAAYRLRRRGHRVTVLEAKPRAGGLSHTARNGDVVTEVDARGRPIYQTATVDDGLYVNLGPGRLPHHHRRILGLCTELGVELQPYIMSSDANWYADVRTGQRFRRRRIEHDARGYVAESAYRHPLGRDERDMVRSFGDLNGRGRYVGTPRAGEGEPLDRDDLVRLGFWRHLFWQPAVYFWQDTMFEPVGGMDQIWRHLLTHVADRVVFNAPVERIRTDASCVRVGWRHNGRYREQSFDWCLSSIPLPILAGMRLDGFTRGYRAAAATPDFAAACKVGWQANRRWWENDAEQIYGGISYTNHPIAQFWYPSHGFGGGKATLTGAYNTYATAEAFARASIAARIGMARRGGALLHQEVADPELVPGDKAVAVAWHQVPHQAGGWCDWRPGRPAHGAAYRRLQSPDGRFAAIGDQVSPWPGWQEGCVLSADRGADLVDGARVAVDGEVPDAVWLTTGDHPDAPGGMQGREEKEHDDDDS